MMPIIKKIKIVEVQVGTGYHDFKKHAFKQLDFSSYGGA